MPIIKIAESTNIKKVSYNNDTKILTITFKNENTYKYHKVPSKVVEDFQKTESPGSFFYKNIRGVYSFEKV